MSQRSPGETFSPIAVFDRFGLVPNFFQSAPDAPEMVERLWEFAKAAYLDNPIPSLFKERLFVYLSRFCEVRYCITRHCAFLLGRGHSSGDPRVQVQTVAQAIKLLMTPTPWQRDLNAVLLPLEAISTAVDWPEPETDLEDSLFAAATVVFVEPRRSDRERAALRNAVGGRRFEYLMGLLTFIRAAHYWTVIHPGMAFENDVRQMLDQHEELARLLLEDPEAARCEMGLRLFDELQALRDLNERRELEKAKQALEERDRQRELLLKEVNHRIKNSLQIVSSILQLQLRMVQGTEAAGPMHSASARVLAIAAVHERLYKGEDVRSVALHTLFDDLCRDIGQALGCPDGIACEATPIDVSTDLAIPLALIVNELVTNSVRHVGPPVRVSVEALPRSLRLIVSDDGQGPPARAREGLGSQMINAFAQQLGATIGTKRNPGSYSIELLMPLPGP